MWGTNANCYAYACNCRNPANGIRGAAIPGGFARYGVFPKQNETPAQYCERLVMGVLADASANGLPKAASSNDIRTLPYAGSGYIIGMVYNAVGFHFFRRDRFTKRWSWKDGIPEDATDKINGPPNFTSQTVTDAKFIEAISTNRLAYIPNWSSMTFGAYFGFGDINGITVSGIATAQNVD